MNPDVKQKIDDIIAETNECINKVSDAKTHVTNAKRNLAVVRGIESIRVMALHADLMFLLQDSSITNEDLDELVPRTAELATRATKMDAE